jgi:hypothetical protein
LAGSIEVVGGSMDEFELEDNLEFILQSIQELIDDQGDDNPFGEVNQNELLANLVNYDQARQLPSRFSYFRIFIDSGLISI